MQIAAIRHLMFCPEEFEVQLCPDSSSWGILCLVFSRQSTHHVPENKETFSITLVIPNQIIHKQRLKHPHIASEIIPGTLSGHCFLCQTKWANKSPPREAEVAPIKYAWNVITHYGTRPLFRGRHNMQIAAIHHLMFCPEEFECSAVMPRLEQLGNTLSCLLQGSQCGVGAVILNSRYLSNMTGQSPFKKAVVQGQTQYANCSNTPPDVLRRRICSAVMEHPPSTRAVGNTLSCLHQGRYVDAHEDITR
ncbi:hypothetical protein CEXT_413591 [Caerostris extrusa]|uniref:Uncharacterized protein n=1 Tax=Caerostris extrusa TaxID=172846 RepID=A0AAV4NVY5_CAEEX|nr:hypothetical protein CEXT_413591 [Caerostris extrusa]